jgi:hypothetical protein
MDGITSPDGAAKALRPRRRELAEIDLDGIGLALDNSEGGFYDPATGDVFLMLDGQVLTDTSETADPDEHDWLRIDPRPGREAYRDMADFTNSVAERDAGAALSRALTGPRPFRRFKDALDGQDSRLRRLWFRFSEARQQERSLEWLLERELCVATDARASLADVRTVAENALGDVSARRYGRPGALVHDGGDSDID